MSARFLAVCVSGTDLGPAHDRMPERTGIDERPVPGRGAVRRAALDGDVQ